jgi:hypothetical protein
MTANNPEPTNVPVPRPPAAVTPSVSARAQLECVTGPDKGKKFRVAPGVTVIGRDPSCDVALTETPVSRQHARIDRTADGWVLKNLSANGTRLNKKAVDEAPLVDGDVIGVGAKTRLRFEVETVALSASGRPQFRARVAGMDEKDREAEAAAEEVAPASLFQRRKKLFIGLGAYALLMIAAAAFFAFRGTTGSRAGPPPVLTLVDMLQLSPGSPPLRIISETADGTMVEDASGQARFVPMVEVKGGQARKIPGIRNALLTSRLQPATQSNPTLASLYSAQAEELYLKRAQDPTNLYKCLERFNAALAALHGASYLPDAKADATRRAAADELVKKVYDEYNDAVMDELSGHNERAVARYNEILTMILDTDNPICQNIAQRKGDIARRDPKLKPLIGK